MTTTTKYTRDDVGCYVDGVRGIYAIERIVTIAESHGMPSQMPCSDPNCDRRTRDEYRAGDDSYTEWVSCECAEIEDECDDYMNEHYAVDGCYWGRSEQGDWGLWEE